MTVSCSASWRQRMPGAQGPPSAGQNSAIRITNQQRQQADPTSGIYPLLNLPTETDMPDFPRTVAEIYNLPV